MKYNRIIIVIALLTSFILLIASSLLYISARQKINQSQRIDATNIDMYSLNDLKEYVLTRPES
jgi:hypothetical protein